MIQHSNVAAEVCIIGRCGFDTGIGTLTYSFCEMLARSFPTCILPTEPHLRGGDTVILPNGRSIPVWKGQQIKASIFVDVLWNGVHDQNYKLVPETGLRLACVVFDSDAFPPEWIDILNTRFDGAVCTSSHLEKPLLDGGLRIPIATLPPALDLEPLLARPYRRNGDRLRIGSIASFHPRKETSTLISAFSEAFGDRSDVELVLHSNLAFGDTLRRIEEQIATLRADNITVSTANLSVDDKVALMETMDIFANLSRGEGYSMGAREALALGKVLVLSDVGGHADLSGCPGVFLAPATLSVPARYVEIDNRVFGEQRACRVADAAQMLGRAAEFEQSAEGAATRAVRRMRAGEYSFSRLTTSFAELINPAIRSFRKSATLPPRGRLPADFQAMSARCIATAGGLQHVGTRIVPAHDGGIFSLLNAFLSHLVWDLKDDRCQRVLPDWDCEKLLGGTTGEPAADPQIGRPSQGNLWTRLFEPLYGLTKAQMADKAELYAHAAAPDRDWPDNRDPLLGDPGLVDCDRQPWMRRLLTQYNRAFVEHIRLQPESAREVEAIAASLAGFLLLGACTNPDDSVGEAQLDALIASLRSQAKDWQKGATDVDWKVFLATDRADAVRRFEDAFGTRLHHLSLPDPVRQSAGSPPHEHAARALQEAYLLSLCRSVVHCGGDLPITLAYMNPSCELVRCYPSAGARQAA